MIDFSQYPIPPGYVWVDLISLGHEPGIRKAGEEGNGWWYGWIEPTDYKDSIRTEPMPPWLVKTNAYEKEAAVRASCTTMHDALSYLAMLFMMGMHEDESENS